MLSRGSLSTFSSLLSSSDRTGRASRVAPLRSTQGIPQRFPSSRHSPPASICCRAGRCQRSLPCYHLQIGPGAHRALHLCGPLKESRSASLLPGIVHQLQYVVARVVVNVLFLVIIFRSDRARIARCTFAVHSRNPAALPFFPA